MASISVRTVDPSSNSKQSAPFCCGRGSICDFKANWTSLFARDSGAIGVLDGTRAVAVSWVLAFHSVLFLPASLAAKDTAAGRPRTDPPAYVELTNSWFMSPVIIGETGVDMFFLLSGFLIAYLLGREYRRSGSIHYCRFLFRRWLRIFPAFITAILLYSVVTFQACAHW